MSGVERFECGCVGIRIAAVTALVFRRCLRHRSDLADEYPSFQLHGVKGLKSAQMSLTSKEWQDLHSEVHTLMYDGERWRELQKLLGGLLRVQS